jgi:pimeloyl-ACP methyl ester carboxylesterase
MMKRNRTDYENFAMDLAERGISSLSIDLRGHGQSIKTTDGKPVSLNTFSNQDFQAMTRDVEAAMAFLRKNKADKKRIAVVGASIGANTALAYAAQNSDRVKAVALLSPGLKYRSVGSLEPMAKYKGFVYLAASKYDDYATQAVFALKTIHPSRVTAKVFSGKSHGTNLFIENKGFAKTLADWLAAKLK